MIEKTNSNSRRFQLAVGIGLVLMIANGAWYRIHATRLASLKGTIYLPRNTLNALPLQLGEWRGHELPLDERIVQATDTEDHVSRIYTREGSADRVSLFLAYGIRLRDLMPHRPEVCYPAAGWTFDNRRPVELSISESSKLPAQILQFNRGGFNSGSVTVLNYYLVDGQYCSDVSYLRSKSWRSQPDLRYVAQVQIAAEEGLLNNADTAVHAFSQASAGAIRELIESAVKEAITRETAQQSQ